MEYLLTYNITPPPKTLLKGLLYPSIKNCSSGKLLPSFVSEIVRVSTLPVTEVVKPSNLFQMTNDKPVKVTFTHIVKTLHIS